MNFAMHLNQISHDVLLKILSFSWTDKFKAAGVAVQLNKKCDTCLITELAASPRITYLDPFSKALKSIFRTTFHHIIT